ncbi:MAG TPA: hypothetical protein VIM42_02190 [Clostridium sp.]
MSTTVTTTPVITTLYQPTLCSPNNLVLDLNLPQIFTAQINALQVDSFQLVINAMDSANTVLYDTGNSTTILDTDPSLVYSTGWTTNTNINIDDSSANIEYYGTGWKALAGSGFWNSTSHVSCVANDYMQYTFIGTGINCYFATGKGGGQFDVSIDGYDYGNTDTYANAKDKLRVNAYSITGLPYGSHTIKFTVLGTGQGAATAFNVEFDYFQVLNTNGSKNSSTATNSISYSFMSNGIDIYADMSPDSGTMQITIDTLDCGIIDLYSSTYNMNTLAYSNMDLTYGTHTIKITVTGNKNSQSTNSFVYFDSFLVTNKTQLTTMIFDKQQFAFTLPPNTVTVKGAMTWELTLWNTSNMGENISSGKYIFTNMSTPTNSLNTPDNNIITNKAFKFVNTYNQPENIPIKNYTYNLYSIHYKVNCGNFGQSPSVGGEQLNCGNFTDTVVTGYHINCGNW